MIFRTISNPIDFQQAIVKRFGSLFIIFFLLTFCFRESLNKVNVNNYPSYVFSCHNPESEETNVQNFLQDFFEKYDDKPIPRSYPINSIKTQKTCLL